MARHYLRGSLLPTTTKSLAAAGVRLLNQGKHAQAERAWRQAVRLDPGYAPAWNYLTEYLSLSKRNSEAKDCLDRLIALTEPTPESLYKLADKCAFLDQHQRARQFLNESLSLKPAADVWLNARLLLAKIDFAQGEWLDAVTGSTEILAVEPKHLEALRIRQRSCFALGWSEEDVADCRKILNLQPDIDQHHRLLFKLNCVASTTPELLFEESRRWHELYAAPLASRILPHKNPADPARRLKIGYVSPDFRHHAIMRLLPGVLENHDQDQFEIFAYSIDTKRDKTTEQVESCVEHFVELPPRWDEIAAKVRRDGIDILVDLAGRTMPVDAFLAFALKPAPIQLTWMGTLATTGLSTMDYFMGDERMPCPGTEQFFSEKVYRLPRIHCCYRSLGDAGIVASPYFKSGYITFASFNDPKKIGREVVKVWSVILHLNPGSKLFLKSTNLEREIVQRRFREWFQQDGIADERLHFEGAGSPMNFQQCINQVDIALDPFPYGGGTTTLETLWMGVPVVSVAGARLAVAQSSLCLLPCVGLPVANTLEQYVAIAGLMAKAIPQQPNSRARLREAMLRSPLMDAKGLARAMEGAYRDIWRNWCSAAR